MESQPKDKVQTAPCAGGGILSVRFVETKDGGDQGFWFRGWKPPPSGSEGVIRTGGSSFGVSDCGEGPIRYRLRRSRCRR